MSNRRHQQGFSLVSAVFLLVVLAGLGAVATRLTAFQQQSTNQALLSTQALHAAKSGAAWGAHRALAGSCGAATLNLTEGGLNGFRLSIGCSQSNHVEGASNLSVFVIDVMAETGGYGGVDYVSRRLQVKVTDGG